MCLNAVCIMRIVMNRYIHNITTSKNKHFWNVGKCKSLKNKYIYIYFICLYLVIFKAVNIINNNEPNNNKSNFKGGGRRDSMVIGTAGEIVKRRNKLLGNIYNIYIIFSI